MIVRLRPARLTDADLLLRIRNDPETRQQSFSTGEVSVDSHLEWLEATLRSTRRLLFVIEEEGRGPVGQVRLDLASSCRQAEVSIALLPEARGRGVGTVAIGAAIEEAAARGIDLLVAKVRSGNARSFNTFERNGFRSVLVEFTRTVRT